jgi:hypothetical protein
MAVNFSDEISGSYLQGSLTCLKILRRAADGRRKLCYGHLSPLKIHRPRPGLNPRYLGPMAST